MYLLLLSHKSPANGFLQIMSGSVSDHHVTAGFVKVLTITDLNGYFRRSSVKTFLLFSIYGRSWPFQIFNTNGYVSTYLLQVNDTQELFITDIE